MPCTGARVRVCMYVCVCHGVHDEVRGGSAARTTRRRRRMRRRRRRSGRRSRTSRTRVKKEGAGGTAGGCGAGNRSRKRARTRRTRGEVCKGEGEGCKGSLRGRVGGGCLALSEISNVSAHRSFVCPGAARETLLFRQWQLHPQLRKRMQRRSRV